MTCPGFPPRSLRSAAGHGADPKGRPQHGDKLSQGPRLPSSDTSDHSGLGNSYWPIRIRFFMPGEMARPWLE